MFNIFNKKPNFNIGDAVKVKKDNLDPEFNKFDLSAWQGRIEELRQEDNGEVYFVAWDSITLKQMPEDYIIAYMEADFEITGLYLPITDLEPAKHRDSEADVKKVLAELEEQYKYYGFDDDEIRIAEILESNDIEVNMENLTTYHQFLKEHITMPVLLTGMDLFPWEERFFFGYGDKKEYERIRETKPSCDDEFNLIAIKDDFTEDYGIIVKVRRTSDRKLFSIPLWNLKCVDQSPSNVNAGLIEDYSFWMTNYR